jgi:Fe-Mn family superoxide dismutase
MTAVNLERKTVNTPASQTAKHKLSPLAYDYAALEPIIDAETMMLHHDQHHASYVDKLNAALRGRPQLRDRSALWLLLNPGRVPADIRTVIRHNAGGHVNHRSFWKAMSPAGHGARAPAGALADAIDRDFGSLDTFKQRFVEAGEKLFGSGWVWLVQSRNGGKLQVLTTNGHGNPRSNGFFPILQNDVWEHAYYLNYQNRRSDYLRAWWSIVNWEEAARCFSRSSDQIAERDWEDEGGQIQGVAS